MSYVSFKCSFYSVAWAELVERADEAYPNPSPLEELSLNKNISHWDD